MVPGCGYRDLVQVVDGSSEECKEGLVVVREYREGDGV